jgi:GNAT superfamily N-acetyltransferase
MHTREDVALPAGLQSRSLTPTDAVALYRLTAAAELEDLGEVLIDLEDIEGDWKRPSLDFERDTLGVLDGDQLVAAAELTGKGRAQVDVHPQHRGRGLGAYLIGWTEGRTRELGGERVGQTVPVSNQAALALFRSRGYEHRHTSWVLKLAPDDEIRGDGTPPPGIVVRPYAPGEERAAYEVVEDAFNEWPDRPPTTYEDWAAPVLGRPGFEPWHLLVAAEGDELLGVCNVMVSNSSVWVNQLAVRADQRGRGLGRVLLIAAFREGRARGATWAELSTDSRTGALGLYEHVGMSVTDTFQHWTLDLRGGEK